MEEQREEQQIEVQEVLNEAPPLAHAEVVAAPQEEHSHEETASLQKEAENQAAEVIPPAPIPPVAEENKTTNSVTSPNEREQASATVVEYPQKEEKKKSTSYRGLIAIALICSLLGGGIGSGITMALTGGNNQEVPQGGYTYPIQIEEIGEVSPVTAVAAVGMPAVVSIVNTSTVAYNFFGISYTQDQKASGSGVILSDEGYIVTNYHVIENAHHLMVMLYDGRSFEAEIIGGDEETDLAVIKIEADHLAPIAIGDSDALQVGELVVAIGNPLDATAFAWTVTDGIVSGLGRNIQMDSYSHELIQTNAAINAGNSGGALLNSKGELIGINTLKIAEASVEGMGFAIPINNAKPIIEQLIQNGYVSKPYIGIGGYTLTESIRQQIGCESKEGVLITQLTEGGPAAQAGLQPGDVIIEANEQKIQEFDQLTDILAQCQVNDMLQLKVERNGEYLMIGVIVGEKSKQLTLQQPVPQGNSSGGSFYPFPF